MDEEGWGRWVVVVGAEEEEEVLWVCVVEAEGVVVERDERGGWPSSLEVGLRGRGYFRGAAADGPRLDVPLPLPCFLSLDREEEPFCSTVPRNG